jgi:hypothetical protein
MPSSTRILPGNRTPSRDGPRTAAQQRTPLAQTCFMELLEFAEAPRIGAFDEQGTVIEMIASGRDMRGQPTSRPHAGESHNSSGGHS